MRRKRRLCRQMERQFQYVRDAAIRGCVPGTKRNRQTGLATIGTGDIERAVGQVSFLRGLEYFERGRVRWIECEAPGRFHGEVAGSRSKPYAVWATVERGSDGRPVAVAGML